jgi:Carboxypeptidase regulatory-like domain
MSSVLGKATYRALSFGLLFANLCLIFSGPAHAQEATGALGGTVTDPSGAVVQGAVVTLRSADTGIQTVTRTNSSGVYSIRNIEPGVYSLEVVKQGFTTEKQSTFPLDVNQTATLNFTLRTGAVQDTVQVTAEGIQLETTTAELGNVIDKQDVNALPLNGRNFTQLTLLSPGSAPANQSGNAAGSWLVPYGNVSFPAVNGQNNNSNMYLLDGTVDFGGIRDTYGIAPILDDVQEFKVQSHNDEARFGQVLGGIVNVVTKAGTNQFHGDVWDFLRNDVLDATPYFAQDKTPLKQNQFGVTIAGPVILPHYNGRNKTFFSSSYEGFRNHTAANNLGLTPTPAELGGDFSALTATQIYNPYSTVVDSNGVASRTPFLCDNSGNPSPLNSSNLQTSGTSCNKIPASLLNSATVNFAKTFFPAPMNTGNPNFNERDTTPSIVDSNQITERIDQQIKERDRLFARYTGWWQTTSGSGGFPNLQSNTDSYSYNFAAHWTHTFGPSTVMDLAFGRTYGDYNVNPQMLNVPSNYLQQSGFAQYFYDHAPGPQLIPSMFPSGGYVGGANYKAYIHWTDIYDYRGDISKAFGKHLFSIGASLATNGWWQPFYGSQDNFDAFQTSDGEGNFGDAMASMVLGIPNYAEVDNVYSYLHGGKVVSAYFQDQWRMTPRLAINMGLRYDLTINPREGRKSDGSDITGDFNLSNGTYVLQNPAPACSATQGTPCSPGGALPAHVVVAKNGKISQDIYDNVGPRLGFAYRLTDKTVLRGAYGMFFDNWAALTWNQSNNTQSWPNTAFIGTSGLNLTNPTGFATDPFNLGSGSFSSILPPPDPWSQSNIFFAPHQPNARSQQYNVGIQRELSSTSTVTVNYVGAHDTRLPDVVTGDAAFAPGPGDPSLHSPYPYMQPEGYMTSFGNSSYNALQLSLQLKSLKGVTAQVNYTWSRVFDIGCDGYFTGCSIQDPYHPQNDRGPATFDQPQVFNASWVYPLPFGRGQTWNSSNTIISQVITGWQLNGILSLASGLPYNISADNSIPNTNNFFGAERADVVGNPNAGTTRLQPFNPGAFAVPAPFTFGNMGRNSLRSDWNRNLDVSVFRSFTVTEGKRLEFRFEAFNATNTPIFGIPDNSLGDPNFGLVSSTASTERQVQAALKFYF